MNADHDSIDAAPAAGAGRQRDTAASRVEGLSAIAVRYLQQAARELDQGRLDHSARALQAAAALDPNHPEVLRLQALLAYRGGQPQRALAPLQRALAQWPDDAAILANLGSVLVALGDGETAVRVFTRASEVAPGQAGNWLNLGLALEAQARHDEAGAALRRALELAPQHPAARIAHAANLATLGDIDAATAAYRAAIAVAPRSAQAWLGLVNLKTSRLDEGELAALERLYTSPAIDEDTRATAGFAFGKALEDHARPDEAFAVFQAANAARRRRTPWDAPGFSRGVDSIIAAFASATPAPEAARGSEVIFVVGMPRSGSTLVEQILSAHPEVEGASELPDLDAVIREESVRRQQPFTAWAGVATPEDWQRLGERYLERTARWRAQRPRHTDKMPDNWLLAGAALAMLPGARVVDCERDALETAWSCYKQWFAGGRHLYAYDFADIAAQLRDHARLVAHWQAQFPDRVRVQSYEALVTDPETEVHALLDFCGLAFDPACLRFHEAGRAVRSASAAQVRQPLRGDTARADAYGDLLAPLRRLLRDDEFPPAVVRPPVPAPPPPSAPAAQPQRLDGLAPAERQRLAMAEAALGAGHGEPVAAAIEAAMAAHPGHVEPMRLLALLKESRGQRAEAIALLRSALERQPDDALLHNTLGVVQAGAGETPAARASFERAFALDPRSAACDNLARMRLDDGDRSGAAALYADALARAPDFLPARLRLAEAMRDAGDVVAAAAEWRACLRQDPHSVQAWSDLVSLCDGTLAAAELEALLGACRRPGLADGARAQLTLAAGRAFEARGRMREAYAMITAANAWRARSADWDGTRFARRADSIAQAFPAQSAATSADLGGAIVFIVDTPRGGAALEHALGAHPDIAASGETGLLGDLVAEESRRRGARFPEWVPHAGAADWQRLGELYLQRSATLRAVKPFSTDRSQALPALLGVAAAMLPGARIIDCRRDPLEACWAWYRDGRGEAFAADLVDLADYWRTRERLMSHWRACLGTRLLSFDGELRGAERARALHVLLEAAGLAPDAACAGALEAHEAAHAAIDAREAGLRKAVAVRDYGMLLQPLRHLIDGVDANAAHTAIATGT